MKFDWPSDWGDRLLSSNEVRQLMDQAGQIVENGAKRRCPVSEDGAYGREPGHLRRSITRDHGRDETGPYVHIGPTATTPDGTPYGLMVELGTRPHTIRSHGNYPLRDAKGNVFGRTVHHPGTPPQPYLRPAVDDLRALGTLTGKTL